MRGRRLPRRARVLLVVISMSSGTFANNALSPMYVIYEQRFGLTALDLTAIFATYAVAVLVALLLVGRLSDDVGRKPLLLAGMVLLVASSVVFLLTSAPALLYLGRAVLGLSTGTLTSAGTAALVDLEPNHDRRRAALITTLGFLGGAALGPLSFGAVAQWAPAPLRTPFLAELVFQVVTLGLLVKLPEPATHELVGFRFAVQRPSVPAAIRRPFLLAGAVVTTGWMVGGIYGSLSGSLDRQLLHVQSHALAGFVLFVFATVGGASQFLSRRFPARAVMVGGILAVAAGVTLVELAVVMSSPALFVCSTVVCGVGNGLAFIGSLALVNEIAPRRQRAELVAAYNVVAYFALSLPVIGVGLLADRLGLAHATLVFAAIIVALSAATLVALQRIRDGAAQETGEEELARLAG